MRVTPTTVMLRSGTYVDLASPEQGVRDMTLHDVAWSLAHINRFSGAAGTYSVAQHSVRIAEELRAEGHGELVQRCGLMHDAHEALIGDISSPFKSLVVARSEHAFARSFGSMVGEERIWNAIAKRFRLPQKLPDCVKRADLRMLATEARDLFGKDPAEWGLTVPPYETRLHYGTPPAVAVEVFLAEAKRVGVL